MNAADIVAQLSEAAKRALVRIGKEWTAEGSPGPSRRDAYRLGGGRAGNMGLIEKRVSGYGNLGPIWEYRLTRIGLECRAILQENPNG